eukprot:TRINITY_DN15774_c0_g1_i1.p1 TRINITY_DN15774_c0_g1~~TRINITY_DN15774_c0_g1_i1.p1  ORF type:complete len:331 (-),score=38.79 TRINITY_DN15774_c0_g1_i1:39-1031(-)
MSWILYSQFRHLKLSDEIRSHYLIAFGTEKEAEKINMISDDLFATRKHYTKWSRATFNILLKSLSRIGNIKRVMELYELMFKDNLIPDQTTLECILNASSLSGDIRFFHLFYSRFDHKGWFLPHGVLKTLIHQLTVNPKPLTLSNSRANVTDFTRMIDLCLRVHNYQKALALFRASKISEVVPKTSTYTTILRGCIRDGYYRHRSSELIKSMRFVNPILPKTVHDSMENFFVELEALLGDRAADAKPAPPTKKSPIKIDSLAARKQRLRWTRRERYRSRFEYSEQDLMEFVPEFAAELAKLREGKSVTEKGDGKTFGLTVSVDSENNQTS